MCWLFLNSRNNNGWQRTQMLPFTCEGGHRITALHQLISTWSYLTAGPAMKNLHDQKAHQQCTTTLYITNPANRICIFGMITNDIVSSSPMIVIFSNRHPIIMRLRVIAILQSCNPIRYRTITSRLQSCNNHHPIIIIEIINFRYRNLTIVIRLSSSTIIITIVSSQSDTISYDYSMIANYRNPIWYRTITAWLLIIEIRYHNLTYRITILINHLQLFKQPFIYNNRTLFKKSKPLFKKKSFFLTPSIKSRTTNSRTLTI